MQLQEHTVSPSKKRTYCKYTKHSEVKKMKITFFLLDLETRSEGIKHQKYMVYKKIRIPPSSPL